jgi:hypothetical protein
MDLMRKRIELKQQPNYTNQMLVPDKTPQNHWVFKKTKAMKMQTETGKNMATKSPKNDRNQHQLSHTICVN